MNIIKYEDNDYSPAATRHHLKWTVGALLLAGLFALNKFECAQQRQPSFGVTQSTADSLQQDQTAKAEYLTSHFRFQ